MPECRFALIECAIGQEGSVMQRLTRIIGRNFGHPRGPVGRLTAGMMRKGNASLSLWMVELLDVKPRDRVLEIGFGPGVALAALVAHAADGVVTGVDASELMVRQVRARLAAEIASGHLIVRQGDAASLPDGDATFDAVCGAHVVYFWPDPVATVRELRRVLRPGGTLALAYQERGHMPPIALRTTGQIAAQLFGPGEVEQVARAAGFADVRVATQGAPDSPTGFCLLATK